MQITVVGAAFIFGVSAFALWLVLMLRQEREHRFALVEASHQRTQSHRRAALDARRDPELAVTTQHVVRAGSFCRVPGSVGVTKRGDALVCEQMPHGRPRWRKAVTRAAERAA